MDSINTIKPRLTSFYLEYLQHHDVSRLIEQTAHCYTQPTLFRLTASKQVETRRAAALVLGFVGTYQANHALGRLLTDQDRSVRLLAENSLKNIWTRDGSEKQRHDLYEIMRQISQQNFEEAVRCANILLEEFPLFAEARNQRAIALFALGSFQDAIEDSAIVLDLNPYHFGAAIGMGHAYLQLKNHEQAIICFQQALHINPNLESVRRHLERIRHQFNKWS
ncbi:MAG: tetratricopeptide repeat protein [Planctomycetaceae bacterium]|nr:tetratricopeptide repeat protein [Planctomycetaceae bacterium]